MFVYRLRKRLRRWTLALSLGAVIAVGTGLVLLLEREKAPPEAALAPAAASPEEKPAPEPPSPAGKQAGRMEAAVIEEMRQQPHADLGALPAFDLPPPLLSIDGTGFRRGEDIIRLDRIVGPRAGAVCLDSGQRWSCGLQARAALHNLVAGRKLSCQPRKALADGGIGADCSLAAKDDLPAGDVAHLLVGAGWAQPLPGGEAEFAAELEKAKVAGAGLWRGGWHVVAP